MDIVREIQTAVRTGKVIFGSRETITAVANGKAKLVIIASNAPQEVKRDLGKYCKISGTPIYQFPGTSWDLGAICNKPFMIAAMAVIDPGESNIMDVAKA